MSEESLRLLTIMFPLVGFQMIGTNFFQSLGMVKKSVILSLSRQILFLLPCLYFLPIFIGKAMETKTAAGIEHGMNEAMGVWLSFPVSDFLSCVLTALLLARLFRKFNRLKDGDSSTGLGAHI
jgi:Na+-driven multidrug efflux pump